MTVDQGCPVDSVVHPVVLCIAESDGVVVVRKFLDKRTCRRDDGLVSSILLDVEHAVRVEVLLVSVGIALGKSEGIRDLVGPVCRVQIHSDLAVLLGEDRIVACDLPVLFVDVPAV